MATRNGLASRGNDWTRRFAFVVGLGLLILWITRVAAVPDSNALKVQGADTIGNPLQTQVAGASAANSTQTWKNQSSANAAAANNVTLAAAVGKITYVTGFEVTGGGATGASNIAVTLTGLATLDANYVIVVPAGATVSITPLIVEFQTPIPASAVNTAITLNVPSFGAGNTNAAAAIHGFQQ